MEDEYLVSCIAFVYANSRKKILYLQEVYNGIRKHYTNMEKRYVDMNATIRGIIYQGIMTIGYLLMWTERVIKFQEV